MSGEGSAEDMRKPFGGNYGEETMERQELYHLIHLQPEIVDRMESVSGEMNSGTADAYLEQMMNRETAGAAYKELDALLTEDGDHFKMLYCQLECARRVFDRYQAKGISKDIYIDTMKCFVRFLEECKKKNGRMFFDRGWWTYRQISMSLFRIGDLEYEFEEHEGERVIAVHIPSDAEFSREAVESSLEAAGSFFGKYYPDYLYNKYTCESWLMSPVLRELLSEKSNILSFQKRFVITEVDQEEKEYIEWLFKVPADTAYAELPEETTLQRRVKTLLLKGGNVGSAYGIMEIPDSIQDKK